MDEDPPRDSEPTPSSEVRGSTWRVVLGVFWALLLIGYPLIVYLLLHSFRARDAALVLLILFLPGLIRRGLRNREGLATVLVQAGGVMSLLGLAALFDSRIFLLHVPVLISTFLLLSFAWTLVRPPPMIERYARFSADDLTPGEIRYCRTLTWLWIGFFVCNATLIEGLILWSTFEGWALYVGVIGYLILGFLFTAELVYRRWKFGRFGVGFLDRTWERLFAGKPESPVD